MRFIIERSDEILTPIAGLSLVGHLMNKTSLKKRLSNTNVPGCIKPEISHFNIVSSYVGLLCHGKNDFDHIEAYRDDDFFAYAMGIDTVPSSPTLRQRLDQAAPTSGWDKIIMEESVDLLNKVGAPLTPITLGNGQNKRCYLPLDVDVSPFDNSKTKKEGSSRTYKGFDGFAPIFAYLGQEGYLVNLEFREGKDHCQNGTAVFLKNSIQYANRVSSLPLLVRMDSGNDSIENIMMFENSQTKTDYIIKRNLRKEKPEEWLKTAQKHGDKQTPREGKTVYTGSIYRKNSMLDKEIRIVFQVVERTILSNGQTLLLPEIEVDTYWTSLPDPEKDIIRLYHEHGTSEQFHSELKTDLDLERLPSGKFATNNLVLHLAALAYNILRILGQMTVKLPDQMVPLRKKAQRRRIRTVIQNLITMAAHIVKHSRQVKLRFGKQCAWWSVFNNINAALT